MGDERRKQRVSCPRDQEKNKANKRDTYEGNHLVGEKEIDKMNSSKTAAAFLEDFISNPILA